MAGIVLVQKFIQPGGKAYTGYVDYMDRPEAIGSRSDLRDYDIFGTYQEYMGNPEKSTGLFNDEDYISSAEKDQIKKIFNQSGKQGGILYQTVLSFEPEWLKENGIMDSDGHIHEDLLREYTRIAVNTIQEKENMKSFVWTAAVHYNTAHPHIHIAMVDPNPSWIPGRGRCKVDAEGNLYQRGKWKESTMAAAKSRIVNKVLDLADTNKEINEIMRDRIIYQSRDNSFHRKYDLQIGEAFSDLIQALPDDMRLWKYGNNAMDSYRSKIDHISDMILKKYFEEDLKSNKNAHVFKQHYAEMLDLKVFDRDSYQLAQIKYGKGNPKENEIKEYNAGVQEYNRAVSEGIKKGVIAKEEAKLNTSALRDLRKRHRPVPGEEKIRYTYRLERILTAIDTLKEDLHAKLDKIAQKANMSLSMGIEKKPSVKEQLDRARQERDPETEQPKFINQGLSPRKKSVRDQLRGHRDRDDKLEPRKQADKGWDMDR